MREPIDDLFVECASASPTVERLDASVNKGAEMLTELIRTHPEIAREDLPVVVAAMLGFLLGRTDYTGTNLATVLAKANVISISALVMLATEAPNGKGPERRVVEDAIALGEGLIRTMEKAAGRITPGAQNETD